MREIQAVARFYHPNIATYHHHFSENGLLFLVMEYCAGGSLRGVLAGKKVPTTDAMRWTLALAEALKMVHKAGVIHHETSSPTTFCSRITAQSRFPTLESPTPVEAPWLT